MSRQLAVVAAAGLAALVVTLSGVPGTGAAFTDTGDAATGSFSAHTVLAPDSASWSSVLLSATVTWPEQNPLYDYSVTLRRISNGAVVSTTQVTGAATSITYTGLTSFGLVVGAGTVDFQVEIRSYLAATPAWTAATLRTYSAVRVLAIAVGATATCTT